MEKITLKAARVNAGYTQKQAAFKLGVSNATLHKWEKGKSFPKQPMIERLCDLYALPYDAIDFAPIFFLHSN